MIERPDPFQRLRADAANGTGGEWGLIQSARPVVRGYSFVHGEQSEAGLNNAPVYPQCCPVRRRRKRAAHVSHQARDFLGIDEALEQRRWPHRFEKLLLEFRERFASAYLIDELVDPWRVRRSGQHGIDRHRRAGARFGQPARHRQLRRLGHAVMDHSAWSVDRAFAADEHDPAPAAVLHAGQVHAAESHAAEHIHFEEPPPIVVGNLLERLGLEDSQVVHQDVHRRELRAEQLGRLRRRKVRLLIVSRRGGPMMIRCWPGRCGWCIS